MPVDEWHDFNAFAWDIASLAIFRLMTGVGLSAMTVVATTYTTEFFPLCAARFSPSLSR
jgi:MFS family permease